MHNSHYKLNLFLPFVAVFLLVVALVVYGSKHQQEANIHKDKIVLTDNFEVELQKQIEYEARTLDGFLEIFKYDTNIQIMFRSRNMQGLYNYVSSFYDDLNAKIDLTHFYFISPNGEILLRIHDKNRYGDVVERFTFLQAQKNQMPFYGIEYGIKQNLTLRTVHPWIVDGKLVGYIELGKEIDKIISKLSRLHKIEFYLAIDKAQYAKQPQLLKQFPQYGDYAIAYNTDKVPENMQAILDANKDMLHSYLDDRIFITQIDDFKDVSGKVLGKIVFLVDTTSEHRFMIDGLVNFGLILFGVTALMLLVAFFYFKKKEKDINYFTAELAVMAATFESSDAIVVTDEKGFIQKVNFAYTSLTGYELEETIGKKTNILKSGHHDKEYYKDMWANIYSKGFFEGELVNKRKNGEEFVAWLTVSAIKDSSEKITNFVGIFRDVTKQKELEKTLIEAKLQAERASNAKSEFVANMSHEIRTPLNAIIGLTRIVLESDLNFTQRDYLGKVYTSSNALLGVINDILDYSKIEARKLEIESIPFELEEVMRNVANLFIVKAEDKGVDLLVDMDLQIPNVVIGDPMRLTQILNNLVGNAIKFTNYGEVVIKTALVALQEETVKVRISVKDTGIGIANEQQVGLFDAFNQADTSFTRKFGGTGLGLTISKHLVDLMGGNIAVHSNLNEGSEFYFEIDFINTKLANTIQFEPLKERLKILVVDDHQTSLDILSNLLQSWNIEVVTVLSGYEAVDATLVSFAEGKPFDTILLDCKMPQMSGFDVVDVLRQKQSMYLIPRIPHIVMMSAYAKDECLNHKVCTQDYEFLIKPISPSSLYNTIVRHNGEFGQTSFSANDIYDSLKDLYGAKILLVEDNDLNQLVAQTLLQKMGLEVRLASDGQMAIKMVQENDFDMIFMDLQMPIMDGFEATKYIKEVLKSNIPIVALSAAAMLQDKQLCKEAGMVDFVSKPFMPKDVADVLLKYVQPTKKKRVISESLKQSDQSHSSIVLDGFELESIITKFDNDVSFVLELLKGFVVSTKKDDDLHEITLLLKNGQLDDAAKIVHKLKGISGNIGATELFGVCVLFEKELRMGSAERLREFKAIFNGTIASVEEYFQNHSQKIIKKIDPTQENIDAMHVLCDELEVVLRKNRVVDGALKEKIELNFAPFIDHSEYLQLTEFINNLDYEQALQLLNTMKTKGFR